MRGGRGGRKSAFYVFWLDRGGPGCKSPFLVPSSLNLLTHGVRRHLGGGREGESSYLNLLLTQILELYKAAWLIEYAAPKLNNCLALVQAKKEISHGQKEYI